MVTHQTSPVKLLVVEDHELARYGLTLALEDKCSQINIIGEAENGKQAINKVKELQPDVVLMDIGLPVLDGISATREIKKLVPDVKVIMLTSRKETDEIYTALASGADAYCMKDIKIDRLCQVIDMVLEGALWLDPAIAQVVLQALPGRPDPAKSAGHTQRKSYNAQLTEREHEVLELIVSGKSNKEIAVCLNITTHTAKAHVCNIIQKLAVDDRTQAAVKALQDGLVES